jgi:hypothetical protein
MRLLAAFDSLGFPAIWFTFENGFKKIERPPHQAGGGNGRVCLNSNVDSRRLNVSWDLGDNGRIKEIGFICMGLPDN